jgi:rubrerythrin
MDIFDFALKMEADGKAYYEKHAAMTDNPELKNILLNLAEEEEHHIKIFKRLKENPDDVSGGDLLSGEETLKNVRNIFEQLAQQSDEKPFGEDAVSVWKTALQNEIKAEAFYREKAALEKDSKRKALLERIADEEENHKQMIDGVIMYLKQPHAFIESAQYKDFQSVEGRRMDQD